MGFARRRSNLNQTKVQGIFLLKYMVYHSGGKSTSTWPSEQWYYEWFVYQNFVFRMKLIAKNINIFSWVNLAKLIIFCTIFLLLISKVRLFRTNWTICSENYVPWNGTFCIYMPITILFNDNERTADMIYWINESY